MLLSVKISPTPEFQESIDLNIVYVKRTSLIKKNLSKIDEILPWWRLCYIMQYAAAAAKSLQSCPTLCDPMEDSPPGSPIPGLLQARTLECVAISFSSA